MALQVILGEFDKVFGWWFASVGKYLLENVGAQLLDTNFVVP